MSEFGRDILSRFCGRESQRLECVLKEVSVSAQHHIVVLLLDGARLGASRAAKMNPPPNGHCKPRLSQFLAVVGVWTNRWALRY